MLQSVWTTFLTEKTLFIKLLIEHIEISMIAILIAIIIGGITGILISEFEKSAKITLGVINFLYTIPSISMLGFLIRRWKCDSSDRINDLCLASDGEKYSYRNQAGRPITVRSCRGNGKYEMADSV